MQRRNDIKQQQPHVVVRNYSTSSVPKISSNERERLSQVNMSSLKTSSYLQPAHVSFHSHCRLCCTMKCSSSCPWITGCQKHARSRITTFTTNIAVDDRKNELQMIAFENYLMQLDQILPIAFQFLLQLRNTRVAVAIAVARLCCSLRSSVVDIVARPAKALKAAKNEAPLRE